MVAASTLIVIPPGARGQLAVGEITGVLGAVNSFHGYVVLLDYGAYRFSPFVRNPPQCTAPRPGFAPLVTTSDWGRRAGVFLAVNGSFSLPEQEYKPGDCLQMIGPIKSFGNLVAGAVQRPDGGGSPVLLFSPVNLPAIKMASGPDIEGAFNVVSGQWQTCASIGPGCQGIPSNGSLLVSAGQNMGSTTEPVPNDVTSRTAIGVTKDSVLVVVMIEGGLPGYSDGIDLQNLAEVLIAFQVDNAVNFDGGGSSTMVYTPAAAMPRDESIRLYTLMKAAQRKSPSGLTFQFTQRDLGIPFASRPTEKLGESNRLYRPVVSHFGFGLVPTQAH